MLEIGLGIELRPLEFVISAQGSSLSIAFFPVMKSRQSFRLKTSVAHQTANPDSPRRIS